MGMNYAEEPFNMGMFFLPKAFFRMGTFSAPNTHIQAILILESPPPPPPPQGVLLVSLTGCLGQETDFYGYAPYEGLNLAYQMSRTSGVFLWEVGGEPQFVV